MKITIYDYNNRPKVVEVNDGAKIGFLAEVSGDEILYVRDSDGKTIEYDSSDNRCMSFFDSACFIDLYDGLDCKQFKDC